jgi:hypothetical protein
MLSLGVVSRKLFTGTGPGAHQGRKAEGGTMIAEKYVVTNNSRPDHPNSSGVAGHRLA